MRERGTKRCVESKAGIESSQCSVWNLCASFRSPLLRNKKKNSELKSRQLIANVVVAVVHVVVVLIVRIGQGVQ